MQAQTARPVVQLEDVRALVRDAIGPIMDLEPELAAAQPEDQERFAAATSHVSEEAAAAFDRLDRLYSLYAAGNDEADQAIGESMAAVAFLAVAAEGIMRRERTGLNDSASYAAWGMHDFVKALPR